MILIDDINQNTNACPHKGSTWMTPNILDFVFLKNKQEFEMDVITKKICIF